jgi:hemolysin III
MSTESPWRKQTRGEEIANGVTHGVGAALAVGGLGYLGAWAVLHGDGWRIAAASVYGLTLVGVFLASTLYHAITHTRAKGVLQRIDHAAIYTFIAGCYTPFTLVRMPLAWGLPLLITIWALAAVGIGLDVWLRERFVIAGTVLYLIMGWLVIVAFKPILENTEPGAAWWLLGGGVSYTVGILFFWWTRLPFHHAIWHVFVLAGSACHFEAISAYVMPMHHG